MRVKFTLDGEDLEINVPYSLSEITFSDFCDFRQREAAYFERTNSDPVAASALLADAVGAIVGDNAANLPFAYEGDADFIDTDYRLGLGDPLSVLRLYAHFVGMVRTYRPANIPNTLTLTHEGKSFSIVAGEALRVLSGRALTTGEAVEVLEYQRRAAAQIETDPKEIGNLDFTLGLTEFAILVRQPGERFPSDETDREKFINRRRALFASLDLEQVLAVRFFLLSTLTGSGKTRTTNFSGKAARRRKRLRSRKAK